MTSLDSVEQAVLALKRGEMVVVVDDDDRENEGDLIAAAAKITPEQMAFMVRHTSGIVCAPMTADDARRLKLDPMVAVNDAPLGTAFTVIDRLSSEGLTTGISARSAPPPCTRSPTAMSRPNDFVRPGHVFPLVAKSGGVLMRSGHTEAAVDLARLAGEPPVGVIAELVNDDGTVKRGAEVAAFAGSMGSRSSRSPISSPGGSRANAWSRRARPWRLRRRPGRHGRSPIGTPFDPVQHLALVFGDIGDGREVPVRLHRENLVEDLFGGGRDAQSRL